MDKNKISDETIKQMIREQLIVRNVNEKFFGGSVIDSITGHNRPITSKASLRVRA